MNRSDIEKAERLGLETVDFDFFGLLEEPEEVAVALWAARESHSYCLSQDVPPAVAEVFLKAALPKAIVAFREAKASDSTYVVLDPTDPKYHTLRRMFAAVCRRWQIFRKKR